MRSPVLALVCALAGGLAALGIGRGTGWLGSTTIEVQTRTVVVHDAAPAGSRSAFSAARIFAERSPGVVTIFAFFGGTTTRGRASSSRRIAEILTNAHVITNAGETLRGPVHGTSQVYVEFPDHDPVPARIVGWDVFDDVGVLESIRRRTR